MAFGRVAVRIGTNLEYAAIHEFGGIIRPRNAPRLVFQVEPGVWRTATQVEIPARPYLRPAADSKRTEALTVAGKVMGRLHEEAKKIGTRQGMLKSLAVTGGVITSAGIVLAATFSVLGILQLVALVQLGFLVAFGILLDTFVVRTVLVPALTFDLGDRIWWPNRLSRS